MVGQNRIQRDAPVTCFIDRSTILRIFAYKIDANVVLNI